jgi:hypothetical protein
VSYAIADLAVLLVAFAASAALSVGTAYALYKRSGKRWVWTLTPVFLLLWLSCGAASLAGFYYFSAQEVLPGPIAN